MNSHQIASILCIHSPRQELSDVLDPTMEIRISIFQKSRVDGKPLDRLPIKRSLVNSRVVNISPLLKPFYNPDVKDTHDSCRAE